MIDFVESPIFDNWIKKYKPQKSILICSPYVKKKALEMLLETYGLENRNNIEFKLLIRGNSQEFTVNKSSDISIFDKFLEMDGFDIDNVHRISNLHMKAYLIDSKYLLITSGNLTDSGMFVISESENFEGGISTDDEETINRFMTYFTKIWEQSQCMNDFYEEVVDDYAKYISKEYSDDANVENHVRRKKYKFATKSKLKIVQKSVEEDTSISQNEESYDFTGLPPVGYIQYILPTLSFLKKYPQGLSYEDLGKMLRNELGMQSGTDERKNKQNNVKFGEEKGKYAAYFGLANIVGEKPKMVKLSLFGERYLSLSQIDRNNYIKDQIFAKADICAILKKIDEQENFDVTQYLNDNYQLKPSTLSRIEAALRSILDEIHKICDDGELKKIIEKVK